MYVQFAPYLSKLLTVATIYFIACVSPGPDMAMTIRNTLQYSRSIAFASLMGTMTGVLMHLTYTLLGLGILIYEFPWIQIGFKYLGAAWLMYIGYKSLTATSTLTDQIKTTHTPPSITKMQAYRLGFFTNALNPFVILLFIGILSNEISPTTPFWIQGIFGIMMLVIAFLWFAFLIVSFSYKPIKNTFLRLGHWLDRATGIILILFGLRLVFAAIK